MLEGLEIACDEKMTHKKKSALKISEQLGKILGFKMSKHSYMSFDVLNFYRDAMTIDRYEKDYVFEIEIHKATHTTIFSKKIKKFQISGKNISDLFNSNHSFESCVRMSESFMENMASDISEEYL